MSGSVIVNVVYNTTTSLFSFPINKKLSSGPKHWIALLIQKITANGSLATREMLLVVLIALLVWQKKRLVCMQYAVGHVIYAANGRSLCEPTPHTIILDTERSAI